jgi:hypothetical protein
MIASAQEFVELRERNDPRAAHDNASEAVWREVLLFFPAFKEWVVRNKTVPISILCDLANDPDARVRFEIAAKRRCPLIILERLARDNEESVRARVAYNVKTPNDLLEMLRHDPSKVVAKAAENRLSRAEGQETIG